MQDSSSVTRTPLAGRNRIGCKECGDVIDGKNELKRTVIWGFWDADAQNYANTTQQEHYCQHCWSKEFKRDAAAHYEVTDAQQFWNLLEAANGTLVADLRPIFVGGRPWIRVVDGDLQAMRATVDAHDESRVIEFGTTEVDVDREWFDETFRADQDLPDSAHPTIALLKPADETPFADYETLPDDQCTFDEVTQ